MTFELLQLCIAFSMWRTSSKQQLFLFQFNKSANKIDITRAPQTRLMQWILNFDCTVTEARD